MDTTNEMGAPCEGTPKKTPRVNSNSSNAQRKRFLERLKLGPVDTVTARSELDILCPAARVLELRKLGYNIETVWLNRPTDCGDVHRVALYVLHAGELAA